MWFFNVSNLTKVALVIHQSRCLNNTMPKIPTCRFCKIQLNAYFMQIFELPVRCICECASVNKTDIIITHGNREISISKVFNYPLARFYGSV
jgi:hypothetical protein